MTKRKDTSNMKSVLNKSKRLRNDYDTFQRRVQLRPIKEALG
jgi:hypothetical protein